MANSHGPIAIPRPLMVITDCWAKDDTNEARALSGSSGRLLNALLAQHGLTLRDCIISSVFNFYPPSGDLRNITGPKSTSIKSMPALMSGKYVKEEFASELIRLEAEIIKTNPVMILSLGVAAAWALLQTTGIKKIRGAPLSAKVRDKTFKVLPTYNPNNIFKDWTLKPILSADLHKLSHQIKYPEIVRPSRKIWVEPTIKDLYEFERLHINSSKQLSIDIETAGTQITCIGFAPSIDVALVVPLTSTVNPYGNYWKTFEEEVSAIRWVKKICALPKVVVGQNFLYDAHHLWRNYGITVPYAAEDTMLLHHALQPEMEKGLGFLGSIYTDEASWKFMRTKHETIKKGN